MSHAEARLGLDGTDGRAKAVLAAGRKPKASPLLRLYPALDVPPFRLLWLGMLPGNLAWQMSVVATGYAALTISGSATALGLVSGAYGFPMLVLGLVGGVVADRLPRRTVLLASQSLLGCAAAALAILALTGLLDVWQLVVIGLVQGSAFAFNMPARQSYVAELVGRDLLRSATALNNAGLNFIRIAGPALAGALLAVPTIGTRGVFLLMLALYGLGITTLLRLPAGHPGSAVDGSPAQRGSAISAWAALVEGLGYIRSSPTLLALLGLAVVTLLLGMPYQQLMPLFAERVFGVGAAGLGLLLAASGVGALAGSLLVAALASFGRPAALQLALGVGFGVSLVGFALAPSFPVAVAFLALTGFSSASYTVLNNTLILANTAPRFFGRVMSVYLMTFAVVPLGALPMSWLADQLGGRPTVTIAGTLVAVVAASVAVLYPAYRRIR